MLLLGQLHCEANSMTSKYPTGGGEGSKQTSEQGPPKSLRSASRVVLSASGSDACKLPVLPKGQ